MKVNKAPEKIYVDVSLDSAWGMTERSCDNEVEYIRTDAFIEKACKYLQINLWRVLNEKPDFRRRFVTDFKKYMKGE